MLILILALVDLHTLFVLLFHNYLPTIYILAGSTFPIIKGVIYYIPTKNLFSLADIIIGILMLTLLFANIWNFLTYIISGFLIYKIILSLSSLKK